MAHRFTALRGAPGCGGSLRAVHECRASIPALCFGNVLGVSGRRCCAHSSSVEVWHLDSNMARRAVRAVRPDRLFESSSFAGEIARVSRFGLVGKTFLRDIYRSSARERSAARLVLSQEPDHPELAGGWRYGFGIGHRARPCGPFVPVLRESISPIGTSLPISAESRDCGLYARSHLGRANLAVTMQSKAA